MADQVLDSYDSTANSYNLIFEDSKMGTNTTLTVSDLLMLAGFAPAPPSGGEFGIL
jgi:hypothetical protein